MVITPGFQPGNLSSILNVSIVLDPADNVGMVSLLCRALGRDLSCPGSVFMVDMGSISTACFYRIGPRGYLINRQYQFDRAVIPGVGRCQDFNLSRMLWWKIDTNQPRKPSADKDGL